MDNVMTNNTENLPEITESNSMTEYIREKCRQVRYLERTQHRIAQINKNRIALGGMIENTDYTPQFVTEKANALKKKTLPMKDYQCLQNALIHSEENVNAFLKVNNVLFALVRDLSGVNPRAQLCAANCCCNIALGNQKACSTLSKFIVPYLMLEMESMNCPLLESCIWTIGNLASGSPKACEILYAQGCVKHFISLLNESHHTVIASVIYAAMHFVYAYSHKMLQSELSELTKAILKINYMHKDSDCLWLLALLSSYPVDMYSVLPTVVECLLDYGKKECFRVKEVTACIRILANTLSDCPQEVIHVLLTNEKTQLLECLGELLSNEDRHVRNETLWLIGNLYNHKAVREHDTFDLFLRMLDKEPFLSHVNEVSFFT